MTAEAHGSSSLVSGTVTNALEAFVGDERVLTADVEEGVLCELSRTTAVVVLVDEIRLG